MKSVLVFTLVLLSLAASIDAAADKVVCYFGSWAVYRHGNGKFDVENIDPNMCTHVIFTFVGLEESGGIRVLDPWNELYDDWGKGAFQRFTKLKQYNPNLKTLVAIGGWNEGSEKYSKAFRDPVKIDNFVKNSINFIQTYGFDGLDLDWEYPNQRGGEPIDVQSFTNLIKALRTEFDKYGYLLTAAVAVAERSFSMSYDVPAISKYLDFINVMAYDFHGSWSKPIGHNAPLFMSKAEIGTTYEDFNIHSSIQAWIRYGAAPEKLVMGVGLYGCSFSLSSTSCITPGCLSSGPGNSGQFTNQPGMLGYNEICVIENNSNTKKYWDSEAMVPYMVFGNQWVSYDSIESAKVKVEYIKKYGLGGAMVWSIETDDFNGVCGKGRFPIVTTLKNELLNGGTPAPSTTTTTAASTTTTQNVGSSTTTTSAPTTTTSTSTTTTTVINPTEVCQFEGYNRDPENCSVFYQCYIANGQYKYARFECSNGLYFDLKTNTCNYQSKVDCS